MSTVLKLKYASEVRRVRLGDEEPSYAAVREAIARAWPSLSDARAKYQDEDGDLCTLIEPTFSDFLAASGGTEKRVLVLELVPNPAPAAPASPPVPAGLAGALPDPLAFALPAILAHKLGNLAEMIGSMPCGVDWQQKAASGCLEKALVWVFAQLRGARIPAGKTAAAALMYFLPKIVERLPLMEKAIDLQKALHVPALKELLEDTRAVVASTEGLQQCEASFDVLLSEMPPAGCEALVSLAKALIQAPAEAQVAFAEALVERQEKRYESKIQGVQEEIHMPLPLQHTRIICDGCEMCPLKGLRFKCKTRPDYDLCAQCFTQQTHGQESKQDFDCIPIDMRGLFQFFHHKMAKGCFDPKGKGKGKCKGKWMASERQGQAGWDSKAWWEWKCGQKKHQDWKNKWDSNWDGNDWVKKVSQPEFLKKQLVWVLAQAQESTAAVAILLHYLPKIIGKLAHCMEKEEFNLRKIITEAPEARRVLEAVHDMVAEREHLQQCEPGFALMLSDADEPAEQALMYLLTTLHQLPTKEQVEFAEVLLARIGQQFQKEVECAKESSWQVSPEHPRHECDGCGMFPIAGPRFHCDADYDLCAGCYIEKGAPLCHGENTSHSFKCIPVDWRAQCGGKGWGGGAARKGMGKGNDGCKGGASSGAGSSCEDKEQSKEPCEDERWTDVATPDEAFEVVSFPELSDEEQTGSHSTEISERKMTDEVKEVGTPADEVVNDDKMQEPTSDEQEVAAKSCACCAEFQATWHPHVCCIRCRKTGGKEHGPHCERRLVAEAQTL